MRKHTQQRIKLLAAVFGTISAIVLGQAKSHAQGGAVARWNLGEQDSGAAAGNTGNATTTAAIGSPGNDLTEIGSPAYDSNVPSGTDSTLSMVFGGGSYYRSDSVAALSAAFDYNNFGLSFDCYPTDNPGYNAPVSMGLYTAKSSFFYITGGTWHYNMNGGGDVALAAATMNAWSHLDFRRVKGTNYWFINGTQVGPIGNTTAGSGTFAPSLCIGGICARTNDTTGPLFDGGGDWYGNVDNVVVTNFNLGNPPVLSGFAISPNIIYSGDSMVFTAAASGDPTGLEYIIRTNGVAAITAPSLPVFINHATTNNSARYDLVVTNTHGSVTSAVVNVTVQPSLGADVMVFALGENDPGAADGVAGNAQTVDAISGNDLTWSQTGSPAYSSDAGPSGGTLSLSFDGSSYYQNTNLTTFFGNLDQGNFSFSADVNCTGFSGVGYSFPISLGRNGVIPGGIAIVETDDGANGEWYAFEQGRGTFADLGPVVMNTWVHFEIQRRPFGDPAGGTSIRAFVNGQDVDSNGVTAFNLAGPILTLAANATDSNGGTEGYFIGMIDNVKIHNYSIGALPTIVSGPTAYPGKNLGANEALTLSATMSGGTPASYRWRLNGTVITNDAMEGNTSTVTFAHPVAGNYDVIVSNSPAGVVTSSIVAISLDSRPENPFIATYNLGEQDPGATNGGSASAGTHQADGLKDLPAIGGVGGIYTNFTAPYGGSTLAMALAGTTTNTGFGGVGGRWSAWLTNNTFNPDNWSMSCDAYPTGSGADGFPVAISLGGNGEPSTNGGIFIWWNGGGWNVHVPYIGPIFSTSNPGSQNSWNHLELYRKNYGDGNGVVWQFFVNGVSQGLSFSPRVIPQQVFTIGANWRGGDPVKPYEGPFQGVIDNVALESYPATLAIILSGGQVTVNMTGGWLNTSYRLQRSPSLSAPNWITVDTQTTDSDGAAQFTDSAPPSTQAFYRTVSP